jgi:hypothetical protein
VRITRSRRVNRCIVTTTINPPTEAVRRFDSMPGWDLLVVGDLKTPPDYPLERGRYLSPAEQRDLDPELSDAIGWNCIQRRNFGILVAYQCGADVVAVVDDDNIPLEGWGEDLLIGRDVEVDCYLTDLPVFDPVGATEYPHLWHRGFPLQLVARRDYTRVERRRVRADVQADLWNGDPDVYAVCRMEHAPHCQFDPSRFPIASSRPSPFNSQNTFLSRAVLPHYFLFPGIGRMDDIWAAYYTQALGYQVVFAAPSVYQERNPHDLLVDFRAELLGYEHNLALLEDLGRDPRSVLAYLPGRAVWAWELYRRHFDEGTTLGTLAHGPSMVGRDG